MTRRRKIIDPLTTDESGLVAAVDACDRVGEEIARRRGQPYDRATLWSEPTIDLADALVGDGPLTAEEHEAIARGLAEADADHVVPWRGTPWSHRLPTCEHGRVSGAGCPHCLGFAWDTSGKLTQEKFRELVDEGQCEREHSDCATGRCHGVHCRRCKETTP